MDDLKKRLAFKPQLVFVTTHGRKELTYDPKDTVFEVLKKNEIPWSAVTIYKGQGDHNLELFSGLDLKIENLSENLFLYMSRNINPFNVTINNLISASGGSNENISTEYIYQKFNNDKGVIENYHRHLTPEDCQTIIRNDVHSFIKDYLKENDVLVVGVSGGGDSNALLHGLTSFKDFNIVIKPIIIKGIPDWDLGVPRAKQLCQNYNLPLKIVEEFEVREYLGIPAGGKDLITRFEEIFSGDDFEFLGTLLIRLSLIKEAEKIGSKYICTGLNLEDLFGESLYRLTNGKDLRKFPVRPIDNISLVFPLWLTPKKIIDGCFPKFSKENYDARYPCFSLGRTLFYQMAYTIQSSFPGIPERLMKNFSRIGSLLEDKQHYDPNLDLLVDSEIPLALKAKFLKLKG